MDPGRGDSLRAAPRKVVATAQAVAGPDRGLPEGEVKSVPTLGRLTPADVGPAGAGGCWMLDLGCWLNPSRDSAPADAGGCWMLDLGCWLNPFKDSARKRLPDLIEDLLEHPFPHGPAR